MVRRYSAQMVIIWSGETEVCASSIDQAYKKAQEFYEDDDIYCTGGAIRAEFLKVREKDSNEIMYDPDYYEE